MRVFFDFIDGPYATLDEDGHECDSAEAIRSELVRALPEVLLGDPQDAAVREVKCSVRDERGSILYEACVTLRVQEMADCWSR